VVTRRYETDALTVLWDAQRCIHTGICLRALPEVFDVRARPWVRMENASTDAIVAAVEKCPTGALRYECDGEPETGPAETTMVPIPNGPLLVRGRLRVIDSTGAVLADETRLALCRCGKSQNEPFCDNSHRRVGFDEAPPQPDRHRDEADSPSDVCPPQDFDAGA
jgi:uncharacterized Fe-S cluster protein YjdI/CDGSH-type Zn-finger protein